MMTPRVRIIRMCFCFLSLVCIILGDVGSICFCDALAAVAVEVVISSVKSSFTGTSWCVGSLSTGKEDSECPTATDNLGNWTRRPYTHLI